MTQRSRTGFAVRLLGGLAVLTGLVLTGSLLTDSQPAFAGTPPPPGTIYYSIGDNTNGSVYYAVKADGTSKTSNLLPGLQTLVYLPSDTDVLSPSYHPYGSSAIQDRWWIVLLPTGEVYDEVRWPNGNVQYNMPARDLFAVRSNPLNRSQLVTVRLTDLYGVVWFNKWLSWSNDPNDSPASFVQCLEAQDIRNAFDDSTGTTIIDWGQKVPCMVNLPITATEIDTSFVPFSPVTATPEELDAAIRLKIPNDDSPPPIVFANIGPGINSPDGAFYLAKTTDWSPTPRQLLKVDALSGTPVQVLWDSNIADPGWIGSATWSPDGKTIAISDYLSGWANLGNIWTMPATAATPPKKVLTGGVSGSTTTKYANPIWSPDNKYLVVKKEQWSGTTLTGQWITRVSLVDGKKLDIVTLPITSGTTTSIRRWVADN